MPGRRAGRLPAVDPATGEVYAEALDEQPVGPGLAPDTLLGGRSTRSPQLVIEEQFGPVLPVLPYGSLDEVVDAANGAGFGLGGSLWGLGHQPARAEAVADRRGCGTAWTNHRAELSFAQLCTAGAEGSGAGMAGGPRGTYGGDLRPLAVHHLRRA
ncbi:aldehyde dehydrogenase family protein [Streptomyces huasconensis]|uniref:aldehyde dehydrogenase family protein n=1 Tax=Streptomyces huasconensis TaxID=1854574 RepID=UPI0038B5FC09